VDNLKYLVNGGRIKSSTAFFGNLLNIKPIMKMDNNGKLCSCSKVISRRKALVTLANDCAKRADKSESICFVSHANCLDDAEVIKKILEEKSHLKPVITHMVPIIGSHSGPGTIAIFFLGDQR
jgi:DegV family protein with EDD domain